MTDLNRSPADLRTENLARMLRPESIAIVGASPRSGHFANQPLVNLRQHGFAGRVFPVNPRYAEVEGLRCYDGISDLPEVPDLAVVVVRPELAVHAVRECADAGVAGVVIVGSGFAETGSPEGLALQDALADIVARTGIRVCGPNTLGTANFRTGAVSYASGNLPLTPRLGDIAIVSQSGGCSFTLLNRAWRSGIGVGYVAVAGNEVDVTIADLVEHYLHQPDVRAVACYLEAVRDPAGLRRVGRLAAELGKVVCVLKSGNSDLGRRAAAAHTGALATSDAVCDAAFRQWGLLRVRTFDELIATTALCARFGPVPKQRIGVYAQGGGLAVVASDLFDAAGLELAELGEDTRAVLKERMPDTTPGNPFDSGGQFLSAGPGVLTDALLELGADPAISTMVYLLMPVAGHRLAVYTDGIVAAATQLAKPSVVLQYGAGEITQSSTDRIVAAGLLLLDPPEAGIAGLRAWSGSLDVQQVARPPATRRSEHWAGHEARTLIEQWRAAGRLTVSEHDATTLLTLYGIDHAKQVLVTQATGIDAALSALEPPWVIKVASDDIAHRSDIGAVRTGITDEAGARAAFDGVLHNAHTAYPDAVLDGATVCESAGDGVELIVGVLIDSTFGPAVMVGIGGIYAEILQDTSLCLAPFDDVCALDMLDRLRGAQLLYGARGAAAVDMDAVVDLLVRVSELAADLAGELTAFEMNPVVAGAPGQRVQAVDALIELTVRASG